MSVSMPSSPTPSPPDGLRLPVGQVTVLLGPDAARRRVTGLVDEARASCASGHAVGGVHRVVTATADSAGERLDALARVGRQRVAVVLVDRVTDGLPARERRAVLAEVRSLAATGAAVLVDDVDPIAALAVADTALRVGADGSLAVDDLATVRA